MDLKLDLSLDGLDMLFKKYEQIMLHHIWQDGVEPTGSGTLWKIANTELIKTDKTISRASVILAANRFVKAGIWVFNTVTGKGGHHRRYFAKMSEEQLWLAVQETANKKINKLIGIKDERTGFFHSAREAF